MLKQTYIQGAGVVLTLLGLGLWFTSPDPNHFAVGSILLTIGVPVSTVSRNPSIHRCTGVIFLTLAVVFISAAMFASVFAVIGGIFWTLGTVLLTDSSTSTRNGVGAVLITFGLFLKIDPGPLFRSLEDMGVKLAMEIGSMLMACGSMLCLAARESDRQAAATAYCILVALRWADSSLGTSWWKVLVWFDIFGEGFPGYTTKLLRLATLPVQVLLLPAVFIYEATANRKDDQVEGQALLLVEEDNDDVPEQLSRLARFCMVIATLILRIDRFLYPESNLHLIRKKYERTLRPFRRIVILVFYGSLLTGLRLENIIWTPVFLKIIPRVYAWKNSLVYAPIDSAKPSIRLLHLEPGSGSDPLRCHLVEDNVHSAHFEALSYAWGGHYTLRRPVKIDGRVFWVTDSVSHALRSLRLRNESRVLWVDQICINQANEDEKSEQVSNKMRFVFQNAQRVIIWLGRPLPLLSEAFEDLRTVVETQSQLGLLGDIDKTAVWDTIAKSKPIWENLLRSKWWSRVWVVQEALLNQNTVIRAGQAELSWDS